MNCVGLMDRDPVGPSFMGFKSAVLVSHRIELRMPNVGGFLKSYETMKYLRMCENFNFLTVAKNIYSTMTAINRPLTGRNRIGRGSCVD
jgi:hypothetical protein